MVSLSLEVVPLAYMLRKLAGRRGKERKQKRERRAGSSGGERWGHCLYAEEACRWAWEGKERRGERRALSGQQWRRGVVPLPICQGSLPVGLGGRGEEENGERAARSSAAA